ncbi:unnamed protein product [Brugia timori]|uniref:Uncharacterized protein n=1 Tax=Brugia timori TaxID=42155 RepID=A0A3P7V5G3_9BILA|nr:unnamed protein product [Brugia timori]
MVIPLLVTSGTVSILISLIPQDPASTDHCYFFHLLNFFFDRCPHLEDFQLSNLPFVEFDNYETNCSQS